MKQGWYRLVARANARSRLLSMLEASESRRANVLWILAYHRVDLPDATKGVLDPTLLSATPAMFAQQMRHLRAHCRTVSIEEVLSAFENRRTIPPGAVLVTFDDGYHGLVETALPILENLRIPAVLFAATDYLANDRMFWWDQLYQRISNANWIRHGRSFRTPTDGAWALTRKPARSCAKKGSSWP